MGRLHLSSRLKSYTGSNANSRSTSPTGGASSRRVNNGGSSDSSPELAKANGLMLRVNVIKVRFHGAKDFGVCGKAGRLTSGHF